MSTPLMSPAPRPTSSAHRTITHGPYSWVASVVIHTLDSATIEPTDRSMPPEMMTNVIPTETTPMAAASRSMMETLFSPRKVELSAYPTMHSATSTPMRIVSRMSSGNPPDFFGGAVCTAGGRLSTVDGDFSDTSLTPLPRYLPSPCPEWT